MSKYHNPEYEEKTFQVNFWRRVDKSDDPDGCWLWTGGKNSMGYGACWRNGKQVLAHRMSWELENGAIPKGLVACHRCDVPACVNPRHIFISTQKANIDDAYRKGRISTKRKPYKDRQQNSAPSRLALLSTEQVLQIRKMFETGLHTYRAIAKMYDVSHTTIVNVVKLKSYKRI